jgi:hypothetical protein
MADSWFSSSKEKTGCSTFPTSSRQHHANFPKPRVGRSKNGQNGQPRFLKDLLKRTARTITSSP